MRSSWVIRSDSGLGKSERDAATRAMMPSIAVAAPAPAAHAEDVATGTVDGGTGTEFQVVSGPASTAEALTFRGNTAQFGSISAGMVVLGAPTTAAPFASTDASDLETGAVLAAGSATGYQNLEIDGPGATLSVSGTLDETGTGQFLLVDGGVARASSWTIGDQARLNLDRTATAEIGSLGTGAVGVVTIDPGAALGITGSSAVGAAVVDNGTLTASQGAIDAVIDGSVSGSGTVAVDQGGELFLEDDLSAVSSVSIGEAAVLDVAGTLSGTGAVTIGAGGSFRSGSVSDTGPIAIGADGTASIDGNLTGPQAVSVGSGGTLEVSGIVSGSAGIALAAGTAGHDTLLSLAGADANAPIAMSGLDELELASGALHDGSGPGTDIGGPLSGFDASDVIVNDDVAPTLGGILVTAATYTPSGPASGSLVLSQDGETVETIDLAGAFQPSQFVVDSAGAPDGQSIVSLLGPAATVNSNGGATTVTGGASFGAYAGGSGPSDSLAFQGDVAVEGAVSTGAVGFGVATVAGALNATVIEAGASIAATDAVAADNVELTGSGATLRATGTLALGGGQPTPELFVLNHASVQVGTLDLIGSTGGVGSVLDGFGGVVLVDPTASFEVGDAGNAAIGALTVDRGAFLTGAGLNVAVVGPVIDDGTIAVTAPASSDVFVSDLTVVGTVTGNGAITLDQDTNLTVDGDLTGITSLQQGDLTGLNVLGTIAGPLSLSTGSRSEDFLGGLAGLASVAVGTASSLTVTGDASGSGPIAIAAADPELGASRATFEGNVSGASTDRITIGAGSSATIDGVVSGYGGISLGTDAALDLFGSDRAVPIAFGGYGLLAFTNAASITGTLSNFDPTDLIQNRDGSDFSLPGDPIVTAATLAGGVLTLSDDGTVLDTLSLAGDTGATFIANAAGTDAGVTDLSILGPTLAPVVNGTDAVVTGGTLAFFDRLAGSAVTNSLALGGNVAVTGQFQTGSLTVGDGAQTVAGSLNAVDILSGGSLAASGAGRIESGVEVDGANARLSVAGTLAIDSASSSAELLVVNGGQVTAGGLILSGSQTGGLGSDQGSTLFVDPTGSVEIGTTGGAALGAVTIDRNAAVTLDGLNATIDGTVVDDGAIDVRTSGSDLSSSSIVGDASGSGVISVGDSSSLFIVGALSGVTQFSIGTQSQASVGGAMSGVGPITIGSASLADFEGVVTGLADVTEGSGSVANFDRDVSGSGTVLVGAGATVTFRSGTVSGLGAIELGSGATLEMFATNRDVPIEMSSDSTLVIGRTTEIDGVISGFTVGNLLDVQNDDAGNIVTGATYTRTGDDLGTLALTDDGILLDTLTLAGDYSGDVFLTNTAGVGGSTHIVVAEAPCFLTGTRIATVADSVATGRLVEELRVGDLVRTAGGEWLPIRWIGHRRVRDATVIRIRRGVLGAIRDLCVSDDHALLVDGSLVPAGLLVDGRAILREHRETASFWHVELDRHAILSAEGVAAESYLDTGNRARFANCALSYDPARALEDPCAEMVLAGERLSAIRTLIRMPAGLEDAVQGI